MFDIRFLPPFGDTVDLREGEITLGEHVERFESPTYLWPVERYEHQWLDAARRLVDGAPSTAFFTAVHAPDDTEYHRWWVMWREGHQVHVQEHLLLVDQLPLPLVLSNPYRAIQPREQISDEGDPISEWSLTVDDLTEFVARRAGS